MPKISLKTPEEIAIMAKGGEILGRILDEVLVKAVSDISTFEIDSWIEEEIIKAGGEPSFKSVPGYHWASCIGLNNEVVHSIPKKEKIIKKGDLLKIDMGMLWKGFHTDLSWTVAVGEDRGGNKRDFLLAGEKALTEAIKVAVPENRVGHISQKIQEVVEGAGFRPVEILTGHGIGCKLHEEPLIPGFLSRKLKNTPELMPGMALAIEVIYNFGKAEVVLEDDGWTVSTKDGKIAGLFEKTIAVTQNGPLILTPLARGVRE